jgi:folate-dependent phosphoribosylglycinamide formyltransferase PurN
MSEREGAHQYSELCTVQRALALELASIELGGIATIETLAVAGQRWQPSYYFPGNTIHRVDSNGTKGDIVPEDHVAVVVSSQEGDLSEMQNRVRILSQRWEADMLSINIHRAERGLKY